MWDLPCSIWFDPKTGTFTEACIWSLFPNNFHCYACSQSVLITAAPVDRKWDTDPFQKKSNEKPFPCRWSFLAHVRIRNEISRWKFHSGQSKHFKVQQMQISPHWVIKFNFSSCLCSSADSCETLTDCPPRTPLLPESTENEHPEGALNPRLAWLMI